MKSVGKRRLRANGVIGLTLVGILVAVAVLALFWTPYNPLGINLRLKLQPPTSAHWLGTDEFGRDVLSRVMAGASISVLIAFATVVTALICGGFLGLVSGYLRGWTDRIIMALNDALLAFPGILLALGVLVILGPGRDAIITALAIAYTPVVARVVRATVLSVSQREFIEASYVAGNSGTLHRNGAA